jgi:hypothetical protein
MARRHSAWRDALGRRNRTVMRLVLAAALSLLWTGLLGPWPAMAAQIIPLSGTVHVKVVPQGGQYLVTVYGTYAEYPSRLDVYVQCAPHSCGLSMPRPCARTSNAERQAVLSEQRTDTAPAILMQVTLGSPSSPANDYAGTQTWGAHSAPGMYWVCAYLLGPHHSGGEPVDPPQATAAARLTIGAGGKPSAHSAPFVLVDFRVTTSNTTPDMHRSPIHVLRQNQPFWLWWTIRPSHPGPITVSPSTYAGAAWIARAHIQGQKAIVTLYDDKGHPDIFDGKLFYKGSGQEKIAVGDLSDTLIVVGQVTINGVTQTGSTWLRFTR